MAEETKEISLESLAALVAKQNETIAALQMQLAATSGAELQQAAKETDPQLPKEPVSHKGKQYQFIIPSFVVNGEHFTAEQAAIDENILASILKIKGQNICRELA